MKGKYTTLVKRNLSKILPNSEKLRYLTWLPKLNFFAKVKAKDAKILENRNDLFDYVSSYIGEVPITYCEFGVFKGRSFKYWLSINTHKESKFYGFDTFTGLPESWDNFTGGLAKGTFNVDGKFPIINDERGTFFKGLFHETLPEFLNHHTVDSRLVINIDADLYSSTLYVLTRANSIINSGTIILFDEFSSMLHEFRALEDYCLAYGRTYKVIAANSSKNAYFSHVAIEIL